MNSSVRVTAQEPSRRTERLSQTADPMEFSAEVVEFREVGRVGGVRLYQVALDRSAFTPGRHSGILVARSRTGLELRAEVLGVEETPDGLLWHTTEKPLQPGVRLQCMLRAPDGARQDN